MLLFDAGLFLTPLSSEYFVLVDWFVLGQSNARSRVLVQGGRFEQTMALFIRNQTTTSTVAGCSPRHFVFVLVTDISTDSEVKNQGRNFLLTHWHVPDDTVTIYTDAL